MSGRHRISAQLARYGLVVGSGYLLAVAFYSGELALGVAPYFAFGATFVVNGIYNFVLIRLAVFPSSGRSVRSELMRFCAIAAISLLLNYASFGVLYSAIGMSAEWAQRLAVFIAAPITFIGNRAWSFRGRETSHKAHRERPMVVRKESYSRM